MAEAGSAAIAATLSADNGTPAYASIWDDEEHLVVAIICNGEVFLPQDREENETG